VRSRAAAAARRHGARARQFDGSKGRDKSLKDQIHFGVNFNLCDNGAILVSQRNHGPQSTRPSGHDSDRRLEPT
jgi:hypothetical protein